MDRFTNGGETTSQRQKLKPKPKGLRPQDSWETLKFGLPLSYSGMVTQDIDDQTHALGILSNQQFCDLAIASQYLVGMRIYITLW